MTRIIVYVATSALALLIANEIIPGLTIDTWQTAVFAAVVLGVLNSFVKPVLVLLTLPITIITLGLFILVINVLLFMVAAWLLPGFTVVGFVPAVLGTLLVSVVHLFVGKMQQAD
jgi:putative membrane protein